MERSGRNSPSACWRWANGWPVTARRFTEPAAGRSGPEAWGVSTVKAVEPLDVYLHVLKPTDSITLPARMETFAPMPFGKTSRLELHKSNGGVQLKIPESARTPIDTIIVLTPLGYGRGAR